MSLLVRSPSDWSVNNSVVSENPSQFASAVPPSQDVVPPPPPPPPQLPQPAPSPAPTPGNTTLDVPRELLYLAERGADFNRHSDTDRFDVFLSAYLDIPLQDIPEFRDTCLIVLASHLSKDLNVEPADDWEGWRPLEPEGGRGEKEGVHSELVSQGHDKPLRLFLDSTSADGKRLKGLREYVVDNREAVENGHYWSGESGFDVSRCLACYRKGDARILAIQPNGAVRDLLPIYFTFDHKSYEKHLNYFRPAKMFRPVVDKAKAAQREYI